MKKTIVILICLLLLAGLWAGCTSSVPPYDASAQKETPPPETGDPAADHKVTPPPETEAPEADPTDIPETEAPNETERPDDEPEKDELPRLSEMERDELIEKLRELGVDLSDNEIVKLGRFNELVGDFEKDPEKDVVSEQPKLNVLFEQVREAVKLYYGDLLPLD